MNLKDLNKFNSDFLDGKHALNSANNVPVLDKNAKLPFDQIPTGVTKTTVAVGEHIHDDLYHTKEEMNDIILANNDVVKANVLKDVNKDYIAKSEFNNYKADILNDVNKDYITKTEFNNLKIGSGNLLMETGFEKVKKNDLTGLVQWACWGTIKPYAKEFEYSKLSLYFPDEGTSGGIYQDLPLNKIPKGTQLVISYDLSVQKNVGKTYMAVEYMLNTNGNIKKVAGEEFLDSSGNAQYGYQYHVFTTRTDIDYNRVRIVLNSHGNKSGSNGEYVVITLKGLMLEVGNTPTSWQKSYYDLEAKITELENIIKKLQSK